MLSSMWFGIQIIYTMTIAYIYLFPGNLGVSNVSFLLCWVQHLKMEQTCSHSRLHHEATLTSTIGISKYTEFKNPMEIGSLFLPKYFTYISPDSTIANSATLFGDWGLFPYTYFSLHAYISYIKILWWSYLPNH